MSFAHGPLGVAFKGVPNPRHGGNLCVVTGFLKPASDEAAANVGNGSDSGSINSSNSAAVGPAERQAGRLLVTMGRVRADQGKDS